jgi:hypothetical protein
VNIPINERAVAVVKINIKGRNVTMREVEKWLRAQADAIKNNPGEYGDTLRVRFFIDPPVKVRRPVLTPRTEYRVEGGTV